MKPLPRSQSPTPNCKWTGRTAPAVRRGIVLGLLLLCTASQGLAAEQVPTWLKPFAWANPSEQQPAAPDLNDRSPWTKPLQLRSDARVAQRTDEYTMSEPTLAKAKLPFNWSNPADASTAPPQRELTDAEQIEFEKKHYVWIRPFYWDNKSELNEDPAWQTYAGTPEQQPVWRLFAPFSWKNPSAAAMRRSQQRTLAYRDTTLRRLPPTDTSGIGTGRNRTVAFQLQDEAPGEQLTPGAETLAPGPASPSNDQEVAVDRWVQENIDQDLEDLGPPPGSSAGLSEEGGSGVLAEAEALGEEPDERGGLQFLRADTVLLDPGEAQFDYGITYQLFDIEVPAINSSSNLEDARFRQRQLVTPLEIRYGLTRKLQVFANVPFGWSNIEFTMSDFELFENDGGIGDVVFGGTFLLREGNHCCSDVVWTNSCSAPTGIDPFLVPAGQPGVPSLGNGTWSLASNLLFIRTYDPLVVFYGFGTRQHFTRDLNGQSFRPGQEYNYQMGVGFAVNSKVTFSSRFSGAYITESRLGGNRLLGTIQEPMVVSLALTIAKCNGLVEPFVDFGVTDEAVQSRFGVIWTRY